VLATLTSSLLAVLFGWQDDAAGLISHPEDTPIAFLLVFFRFIGINYTAQEKTPLVRLQRDPVHVFLCKRPLGKYKQIEPKIEIRLQPTVGEPPGGFG